MKFLDGYRGTGEIGCDFLFLVDQRARGTGNYALPTTDAGRFAHGKIFIKSDASLVAFAPAGENKIVPNLAATANATLAQDAGVVIDGDRGRGIVVSAWCGQARIAGGGETCLACKVLQLAVVRKLLPLAGRWKIGRASCRERV